MRKLVVMLAITGLAGCGELGEGSFGLVCSKVDGQPLDRYLVHSRDKVIKQVKAFGDGYTDAETSTFAGPRIYATFDSGYTDRRGKPIMVSSEIDLDKLTLKYETSAKGSRSSARCEIRDLDDADWQKF